MQSDVIVTPSHASSPQIVLAALKNIPHYDFFKGLCRCQLMISVFWGGGGGGGGGGNISRPQNLKGPTRYFSLGKLNEKVKENIAKNQD